MVWQVQVTLVESVELEVSVNTDEVYGGCICADEARTFRWGVRATSLGTGHRHCDGIPCPAVWGPLWRMWWWRGQEQIRATWEARLHSTPTLLTVSQLCSSTW